MSDKPKQKSGFSGALIELKYGCRVAREGWNGKGMWLKLVHGNEYELAPGLLDSKEENPCNLKMLPWIGMKTADGSFVPWTASQTEELTAAITRRVEFFNKMERPIPPYAVVPPALGEGVE